jgi:beta-lactamase regulating signal transducer with metallopeptidase domain
VIALYLLFLCYRSSQLWLAWRRARMIAHSAYSVELPERVQAVIDECQTVLGVRRFQILCSSSVAVPITVGSLDPLVILPEQLLLEADRDVLTSAIGHELVHVWRRDYALNLLYELIALPLAFHPATALLRRRIRETRELGCDELVTERLLDAAVYARSLVQLAGAAITVGRPTATITVGIADADILEERVMTILRRPQINVRRKNLLLVAAALVFIVPCAVAAPFALRININSQDAAATPRRSIAVEPGTLTTWLKSPGEAVERGDAIAEVKTDKGLIKVEASTSGVIERLLVQLGEKVPAGARSRLFDRKDRAELLLSPQEERERNEVHEARLKVHAELEEHRRVERERQGWAVTISPDQQQEPRTFLVNTVDGPRVFTFSQDPQQEARQKEERRA